MKLELTMRRVMLILVMTVLALSAGTAIAVEEELEATSGRQLAATTVARIDAGIEARVLDETVAFVELEVYDVASDTLIWTSGRVSGSAVVWPVQGHEGESFRLSLKGWDRQDNLVTHQVTTKNLAPIADITFDNIPDDTKVFAAGEIDLDGDVIVHGSGPDSLEVIAGGTNGAGLRIDATAITGFNEDALEIELGVGNPDGQQAIEVQRGNSNITAQVLADGRAWFQNQTRKLPLFLPVAFGAVDTDGTVLSGSGNFTATWNAASTRHEITVTGFPFALYEYTAVVTPIDAAHGYMVTTTAQSDKLYVYIWSDTNTKVQQNFTFVVYDTGTTEAPTSVDPGDLE